MLENIFAHFLSLLEKKAVSNKLLSTLGYSLYAQVVLVSELAVI